MSVQVRYEFDLCHTKRLEALRTVRWPHWLAAEGAEELANTHLLELPVQMVLLPVAAQDAAVPLPLS